MRQVIEGEVTRSQVDMKRIAKEHDEDERGAGEEVGRYGGGGVGAHDLG